MMEKEKQAFEKWFSVKSTDEEIAFATKLYNDSCYPVRFSRGFYAGYHSSDKEIAALKAEIERKDESIKYASNMIVCAVASLKDKKIRRANQQLNSGLSALQEALQIEEVE